MELTKELRSLVKQTVSILGQVLQRELGETGYRRIEDIRFAMTEIRNAPATDGFSSLHTQYRKLEALSAQEQHDVAHAFTLMLELMNSCENAYRSHRINMKNQNAVAFADLSGEWPQGIVYVLTAHPTEARSPQNIAIFHEIQSLLIRILERTRSGVETDLEISLTPIEHNSLMHSLEIAWRTSIVRSRIPKVKDEAEHIYSLLFRNDIFYSLIERYDSRVPFYVRSWVGGDKDGHPGVNEKTLLQSLTLSRGKLLNIISHELSQIRKTIKVFSSVALQEKISKLEKLTPRLKKLKTGDSKTVLDFTSVLSALKTDYEKTIGAIHPRIHRLTQIIHTFPALVVPLELRESSDVLMSPAKGRAKLPIYRMLSAVERISRGGIPRSYVRGFIISMTESIEHIQAAAAFQRDVFGNLPLPIIPLFEESRSLAISADIMRKFTENLELKNAAIENWGRQVEMMVGYSDSAKEAGVLASRVAISNALPQLEDVCQRAGLNSVFFHGSGGSIDRGGGSIEDQTAWWPKSALRYYKVTVQGEMIERSLATPAIAKRQIEIITESAIKGLAKSPVTYGDPALELFANEVSGIYRRTITSPDFLKLVSAATPYSYLKILKIGSRPAKRTVQLSVKGLRAIPWVMCWTQTRVLFPTWWGVGSAWAKSSVEQKAALKISFQKNPAFTSFIKALGFTLAKTELNIWKMYLEQSNLTKTEIENAARNFQKELQATKECYFEICGQKELLWFRPWLGESIILRSPMIHPLNLLQIIAKKNEDIHLLRVTTTGISSGMMTTG